MDMIKTKSPGESETIKTEVVCPNDTNPMGILQGGRLVAWMDIAAAVCAQTHAGKICVTVSIDRVDFKIPAKIGDIITIKAVITRSFKTSLEIHVQSYARKVKESVNKLISDAFFRFVALDDKGKPTTVPGLVPDVSPPKK
ncbi:MAG: acyl-CoA thioesterase [Bacteroidetes bacterium]|nr:acyl-CoA thioesterase [Bacteroidota bacterium]